MGYDGLRDWLEAVEKDKELRHVSGADCHLEMAGIAELIGREGKRPAPAILFDDIPGYPKGYRTLFGILNSPRRIAMTLGILEDSQVSIPFLLQKWVKKLGQLTLIPPKTVVSGPIQENVLTGDKVDLTKFPWPWFHELDCGRYIGTGDAVIQRDPDTGHINVGCYRSMLVDGRRCAIHATEGQDWSIIAHKYLARGQVMPVAIAVGIDPLLWFASASRIPFGTSEYDFAGGIKGEPIETIKGAYTGLPLPAQAELVIEGEVHPGDLVDEGPFGEWNGYYANLGLTPVPEPLVQVKTIYSRNDPIITCACPGVQPSDISLINAFRFSATVWDNLEKVGIPGIKAVWSHQEGGGHLFTVVSIRQMYSGHAKQTGLIASQASAVRAVGRYTVVVDEDIDPCNLNEVIWAMATRTNPERGIQILSGCPGSSTDPIISPEEKQKVKVPPKPLLSSRVVIDACQPFEWKKDWYPVARISSDYRRQLLGKWDSLLKELLTLT